SIHMDLLWRNFFMQEKEFLWKLIGSERQALERLDIPYFSAKNEQFFSDCDHLIPDFKLVAAKDRLRQRFASLQPEVIKQDIAWMRASISMRIGSKPSTDSNVSCEQTEIPSMERNDLIDAA